jgi:hypothetical protein
MSVGNLTDSGNKGNNFPYQLAVLQLLEQIATMPSLSGCCPNDATEATLSLVYKNSISKIDRIKGTGNYKRVFTYDGVGTSNVISIVHTGTTAIGNETITETFTYVNPAINGSNVTQILYS